MVGEWEIILWAFFVFPLTVSKWKFSPDWLYIWLYCPQFLSLFFFFVKIKDVFSLDAMGPSEWNGGGVK